MASRFKADEQIEVLVSERWVSASFSVSRLGLRPNLDSFHTDTPHELTVIVEIAGVDPQSLSVTVSERILVVAGERIRPQASGRVYQQMEIEVGRFERHVHLVEGVDPELARARYQQGMLTISLPISGKSPPSGRHGIPVECA